MQLVLNKSKDVWHAIVQGLRRSKKAELAREMEKNSITSGPIVPEVWIMSGLLLSLVQQIVAGSLQQKPGAKPGTNMDRK